MRRMASVSRFDGTGRSGDPGGQIEVAAANGAIAQPPGHGGITECQGDFRNGGIRSHEVEPSVRIEPEAQVRPVSSAETRRCPPSSWAPAGGWQDRHRPASLRRQSGWA